MKRRCVLFPLLSQATRPGLAFAVCWVLLAAPGGLKANESKAIAPDLANEVANLFDLYCLKRYPDLDAMGTLALQRGDEALPAKGLPKPGKVWAVRGPSARSVVSAMAGPSGGCSVRRMSPVGLADTHPFLRVLDAFAKAHSLTLLAAEPMLLSDVKIAAVSARDQSGSQVELFTVAIFNFRGHRPADLADAGEDGPGLEIYLGRGANTLPEP